MRKITPPRYPRWGGFGECSRGRGAYIPVSSGGPGAPGAPGLCGWEERTDLLHQRAACAPEGRDGSPKREMLPAVPPMDETVAVARRSPRPAADRRSRAFRPGRGGGISIFAVQSRHTRLKALLLQDNRARMGLATLRLRHPGVLHTYRTNREHSASSIEIQLRDKVPANGGPFTFASLAIFVLHPRGVASPVLKHPADQKGLDCEAADPDTVRACDRGHFKPCKRIAPRTSRSAR